MRCRTEGLHSKRASIDGVWTRWAVQRRSARVVFHDAVDAIVRSARQARSSRMFRPIWPRQQIDREQWSKRR